MGASRELYIEHTNNDSLKRQLGVKYFYKMKELELKISELLTRNAELEKEIKRLKDDIT